MQAVQTIAQRALQGARGDERQATGSGATAWPMTPEATPTVNSVAGKENTSGMRLSSGLATFSEVAPVLDHVQGPDRQPMASPAWHSPVNCVQAAVQLMPPDRRSAMAACTAQSTTLTPMQPQQPPGDGSSTGSVKRGTS